MDLITQIIAKVESNDEDSKIEINIYPLKVNYRDEKTIFCDDDWEGYNNFDDIDVIKIGSRVRTFDDSICVYCYCTSDSDIKKLSFIMDYLIILIQQYVKDNQIECLYDAVKNYKITFGGFKMEDYNGKYYDYLNDLRARGIIDIYGSTPYLLDKFKGLTEDEARDISMDWIGTHLL